MPTGWSRWLPSLHLSQACWLVFDHLPRCLASTLIFIFSCSSSIDSPPPTFFHIPNFICFFPVHIYCVYYFYSISALRRFSVHLLLSLFWGTVLVRIFVTLPVFSTVHHYMVFLPFSMPIPLHTNCPWTSQNHSQQQQPPLATLLFSTSIQLFFPPSTLPHFDYK